MKADFGAGCVQLWILSAESPGEFEEQHETLCCNTSLEPSRRDGANEGLQHSFLLRKKKIIQELSPKPHHLICSELDWSIVRQVFVSCMDASLSSVLYLLIYLFLYCQLYHRNKHS